MRILKHQILVILLCLLALLSACFIVVFGWYIIKDRDVAAAIVKAQADLATCEEIIDTKYPGSWSVRDGDLYKGSIKISFNNDLVDHLSVLTGDTVTVFLGDTRVATTVYGSNGERAIGTKVSDKVANTVLQNGQIYLGEADVVGEWYQAGYIPLRADNGNIIGMFYVGISHAYEQEFIRRSFTSIAEFGLALIVLVTLFTWLFLKKIIIYPSRNIRIGPRKVVTGHLTQKVNVSRAKEIEELWNVFNQMAEQIQALTGTINRVNNPKNVPTVNDINDTTIDNMVASEPKPLSGLDTPWCSGEEGLPKGLNKYTLSQIFLFLQTTRRLISAEEVAEGVKLNRVTVRRYLEFLEQRGVLKSEQRYGTVGRPVKLFIPL